MTWQNWDRDTHRDDFFATVAHLNQLRRKYPALRPRTFTKAEKASPEHDHMLWFSVRGDEMTIEDWHYSERRTVQRLTYHLMNDGTLQGLLLTINGTEAFKNVRLPRPDGVTSFELLWDSALELPPRKPLVFAAGANLRMVETSMQLFAVR